MIDFPEAARPLAELKPPHGFFIGLDSDGCAFDAVEVKHEDCFTLSIIRHWSDAPLSVGQLRWRV